MLRTMWRVYPPPTPLPLPPPLPPPPPPPPPPSSSSQQRHQNSHCQNLSFQDGSLSHHNNDKEAYNHHDPPQQLHNFLTVGTRVFVRPKSAKEMGLCGIINSIILDGTENDGYKGSKALVRFCRTLHRPRNDNHHHDDNNNTHKTNKTEWEMKSFSVKRLVPIYSYTDNETDETMMDNHYCDKFNHVDKTDHDEEFHGALMQGADRGREGGGYNDNRNDSKQSPFAIKKVPNNEKHPVIILLTPETHYYRHLASSQIQSNDYILEIGCSTGECSSILIKYAYRGYFVGMDVSHDMIECCTKKLLHNHSTKNNDNDDNDNEQNNKGGCHIRLLRMDPFLDPRGAAEKSCLVYRRNLYNHETKTLSDTQKCHHGHHHCSGNDDIVVLEPNVVFIDIGGNRNVSAVVRMIQWSLESFSSLRLIVVKSRELVQEVVSANGSNRGSSCEKQRSNSVSNEVENLCAKKDNIDNNNNNNKPHLNTRVHITRDGLVLNGSVWFQSMLLKERTQQNFEKGMNSEEGPTGTGSRNSSVLQTSEKRNLALPNSCYQLPPRYEHPLKAPLSVSPLDGITPICRYKNYHRRGCKKEADGDCPYDHDSCHWCHKAGHVALSCPGR